ncbi:bifunctional enoyl-CoA hydratase/phosphate acetyltransferase [Telmatobacter bradus]|uniref:bifunctional enoyl-CoA hydratase/phosphate acetyltransferase n=1 Tax=Telmatobacter bradus TaxID=474953 RepID=UPI003B43A8AC
MADLHIFNKFIERTKALPAMPTAVVWPLTDVALEGAVEAAKEGIIDPIMIGPEAKIKALAAELKFDVSNYKFIEAATEPKAAELGCIACRDGKALAMMKGSLHTDDLMRAAMNKETGLRGRGRISHVFILDTPAYERTVMVTDAAINIAPELEDKFHIINNAIALAHGLGIEKPNVAILAAVETVNPKMPVTLEAAALCKMADRGQITGAVLDGPLSFDTAISTTSAKLKKLVSPVSGHADILVAPDLEAGNMLVKELVYWGGAQVAGLVLGARVPIILTSRADSAATRLTSCAVAALLQYAKK